VRLDTRIVARKPSDWALPIKGPDKDDQCNLVMQAVAWKVIKQRLKPTENYGKLSHRGEPEPECGRYLERVDEQGDGRGQGEDVSLQERIALEHQTKTHCYT
jgi:hypothetical protein